ncbi:hypothetical protein [Microbacterium soli]|uniref:Uncharacterized protein n=1 Tax=Microbacterium soli TaxID=446075 RepID=A0ABP7NJW2_9MICO
MTWPNGEVVDVESIEAYAEEARLVAHPLDDGTIRTPDWVIASLADVSRWASRMVLIIENAETLKRQASADLADARAQAVLDAAGFPVREQASRVRLATMEQRKAYDRAVVAFEKARRVGNLLSDYTGRVQSIGKQVELTYRHGGVS